MNWSPQFPPTPWGVNDDGDVSDEGGDIVAINPRLGSFPAHLLAAAPELYEAVRLSVNLCAKAMQKPLNLNGETPYDIAMRALAKARGDA